MAYVVDLDNENSCIDLANYFYYQNISDNGNFIKGNIVDSEFETTYMGVGIEDCYYFNSAIVHGHVSGSGTKYDVLGDFFRFPFFINDNKVRPFFVSDTQNHNLTLYVGVEINTQNNWNFTTNNYGDSNKDNSNKINDDNIIAHLQIYSNYSDKKEYPRALVIGKNTTIRNYGFSGQPIGANIRRLTDNNNYMNAVIESDGFFNERYHENSLYTLFDTNIPVFDYNDKTGVENWVNNGIRDGEVPRPRQTKTDFKLWIKGTDVPSYKLNWHNEILETSQYDFNNTTVVVRAGHRVSDGVLYFDFIETPWTDGSVKFTFYDLIEGAHESDNLIFPWISLECYVKYGNEESGKPSIELRRKGTDFHMMYQNVTTGDDSSNIEVVNYDDDPSGYDDDDDDYHDPEDNEDPTVDPSIDIDITNELCRSYVIAPLELKKLSQFLWSDNFIDNIKLINNTPIENIVSLKAIIGTVVGGVASVLTLGNVETNSSVNACNEVHTIDVGSITIPRKYNNFLDFEPYTKISMYLPFYGTVMLDSSIVVGRTISIKYIIDVITGTAKIKILHDSKTLYEYKCTCGADLPITSSNRASVEMGYISSGIGLASSVASGNLIGGTMSLLNMAQSQFHSTTAGNCNGVLNFHDSREVTVIVDRPVYQELVNFNASHGRVCNLSKKLGDLSGFTICNENVRLNFNCLKTEEEMLRSILSSGFII